MDSVRISFVPQFNSHHQTRNQIMTTRQHKPQHKSQTFRHHVLTTAFVLLTAVFSVNSMANTGLSHWHNIQFHDKPQLNLHLYLYELARDNELYLSDIQQNQQLTDQQKNLFSQAVTAYQQAGANQRRHILFSNGEIAMLTDMAMNNHTINANTIKTEHCRQLCAPFLAVQPVWHTHFRPQQHRQNQRWLQTLQPLLNKYGTTLEQKLEHAFQRPLVDDQHQVDIVYKPGMPQGATTSGRSAHTIINASYSDFTHYLGLEMLFHEVAHAKATNRNSPFRQQINALFRQHNVEQHTKIWHVIHFYTVGKITQQTIQTQVPDYIPYADKNGLYRGQWQQYHHLIEQHWQPWLDHKISMETALNNLAVALKTTAE